MSKKVLPTDRSTVIQLGLERTHEGGHQHALGRSIVRIHVLGSMRATTYLGANVLPRGKKARAILGYLSVTSGGRASRSRLAGMLWDRASDAQARSSFRGALHELSLAMGPLANELISADRETVRLTAKVCWIDATAVLAPEVGSASASRSELSALCNGELLEELDGISTSFDQWLLSERTRFNQQLSDLLEGELNELTESKADLKQVIPNVRRLIAFDPTHEGASRALMRALMKSGERVQALREYERCRKALRKALDVDPSPETRALGDAIRTFSQGGDARRKPIPSSAFLREDLKVQLAPAHRRRLRLGVLPFLATRAKDDQNLALSLSSGSSRWACAVSVVRRHRAGILGPQTVSPSERRSASAKGIGLRSRWSAVGEWQALPDQCSPARCHAVRFPGLERSLRTGNGRTASVG